MDAQQSREWLKFEQQARKLLRSGYKEAGKAVRLFQILIFPSFDSSTSWEVFRQTSTGQNYFAVQTTWRSDKEFERLMSCRRSDGGASEVTPVVEMHTIRLQASFVEDILQQLAAVHIPAWIEDTTLGIDGTSFEVVFGGALYDIQYKWWQDPPESWKPLTAIIEDVLVALDSEVIHQKGNEA